MPTDEAKRKSAATHLASQTKVFNQGLHSLDDELKDFSALFKAEEVLISHPADKAKPIIGSFFSKAVINEKEQFFDAELITLKKACDGLIAERRKLSKTIDKKLKSLTSATLSSLLQSSKEIESSTSRLRQLNTHLSAKLSQLHERTSTIQAEVLKFSTQRDKFLEKEKALRHDLSSLHYDPDFKHDDTTEANITELSGYTARLNQIDKTLRPHLGEQVSTQGRKIYQNAAHRYETASNHYQYHYDKLCLISAEITKTTTTLNERQRQLDLKTHQYQEHLLSLKQRAQLTSLNLTHFELSKPPYNTFDAINDNIVKLPVCLSRLQTAEQSRQTALKAISKHVNWIDITLALEDEHYKALRELERGLQEIYAPIHETVYQVDAYIKETKTQLSTTLRVGLERLSTLTQPLSDLNLSVKGIGLNRQALKGAQRAVDDAALKQTALKDFATSLQSLSINMLFAQREMLLEQLSAKIESASKEISSSHQTLISNIIAEKQAYNERIQLALSDLAEIEARLDTPFYAHTSHYFDPGEHCITLDGRSQTIRITRSYPAISFTLNDKIESSLNTLLFPATPYTADVERGLFIKKRAQLDELNHQILMIKQDLAIANVCSDKRSRSSEIDTLHSIRELVKKQLQTHFVKDIDHCHELLQEIDNQITLLETQYCHLQFRNKNAFIQAAIDTVEKKIIHNDLESLSDQEKKMFTQFVRRYILCPLKHLLEKTKIIDKGHLTFFAGENEIAMKAAGDNVIQGLNQMLPVRA